MNESGMASDVSTPETILIVGGSSDIGLELMRRLAPERPLILAHYQRSLGKLGEIQSALAGTTIAPLQADLADPAAVDGLIAAVRENHPLPDKIVHLAAPKLEYVRFQDATWDQFELELNVQLRSLMRITQAFLPEMARRKRGKVVVALSSVTVGAPPAAMAHYVTAKFALWGLVRALASEYSSRRLNINAVSPSMVETAFLEKLPERMVEIAAAQHPRGRNATPSDVAAAVRFLLSPEADYITGINLPISGGAAF